MTQELQNNREDFISRVTSVLSRYGFIRTGDVYKVTKSIRHGARQVIINGELHEDPGMVVPVDFKIDLGGTGFVADMDDQNKDEFEAVDYEVSMTLGERTERYGETVCVPYNDFGQFETSLKRIFHM